MNIANIPQRLQTILTNIRSRVSGFSPFFPSTKKETLLAELTDFFHTDTTEIDKYWDTYQQSVQIHDYQKQYGGDWEHKHLSTAEAFIIFSLLRRFSPSINSIIEIGTQYGMSTRRIIDILHTLQLTTPITAYDIEDQVRYFSSKEAKIIIHDLTGTTTETVLKKNPPGLIYLDAHPYALLHDVIESVINDGRWILCIHDCGIGMYNPHMPIHRSENERITSMTGMWERYALAAALVINDPGSPTLEHISARGYTLRIFGTEHGLAVLIPNSILHGTNEFKKVQ